MAPTGTYRMISARVSPMVELARWMLERYEIPYREEAHAPMLHVLGTLAVGGGVEVPAIVTPGGAVWKGARETLAGIDAVSPSGRKLYGETPEARAANQALIEALLSRLLQQVRRFVYHQLLPHKRTLLATVIHRAPAWERWFVAGLYPVWRLLMVRGLRLTPDLLTAAPVQIEEALTLVETELARRGTPFLDGAQPGPLDIVFSALAGPLVFPPNYGARLPPVDELPASLKAFVATTRSRPAGDLIRRTYDACRYQPDG
jgi:glutathione S-transferase